MTAVDLLGFWFPITGLLILGLMWIMLRDTVRTPPRGDGGGSGGRGGSDRVPPPRPPWSWTRRARGDGGTRARRRIRAGR